MAVAASTTTLRRHVAAWPQLQRLQVSSCSGEEPTKPWRLSSSVIILGPSNSVPDCTFSLPKAGARQDYKICFVKRAAKSSFMPDAMVFPGGAVEAEDSKISAEMCGSAADDLDSTLRCAAVREVFEESGIGIFKPMVDASGESIAAWRTRVHDDATQLANFCKEFKTTPACSSLHYWCSFITPDMEHARLKKGGFDTRFYVWCGTGAEYQLKQALADAQETVSLVWLTPDEALKAVAEGKITMAPPQWYITQELAETCQRLADVPGHAASSSRVLRRDYPIKPYPVALAAAEKKAVIERLGGTKDGKEPAVFGLVYPGDEAHPVFPGPKAARHRMLMNGMLGQVMQYDLQLDDAAKKSVPLKQAKQDWYRLAKL